MDEAEKKKLQDDICNNINSLLVASGGTMTMRELQRDYYEVVKKTIPFKDLGYPSLEVFLKSIPDAVRALVIDGQVVLKLVVNEASSHILKMVLKQKKSKKAKSKAPAVVRAGNFAFCPNLNARPSRPPLLPTPRPATPYRKPGPRPPFIRSPSYPKPLPVIRSQIKEPVTKTLSEPTLPITTDLDLVQERIAGMIEMNPLGMMQPLVELDYKLKYKERLPADWLELVFSRGEEMGVCCERAAGSWIVLPTETTQIFRPVPVEVPNTKQWNVILDHVEGINVFLRILVDNPNDEVFTEFITKLEQYYNKEETKLKPVPKPETGVLYVAKIFNEVYNWERVEVEEATEGFVRVRLVDRGDSVELGDGKLYPITKTFGELPCQAVRCVLAGFEAVQDIEEILEAVSSLNESSCFFAEVTEARARSVMLYTEEGTNMNMTVLLQAASIARSPSLPSAGNIQTIKLHHATPSGDLYVQQEKPINRIMVAMLDVVSWEFTNLGLPATQLEISALKRYLVLSAIDAKWHRVKIVSEPTASREVEVFYVDTGKTAIVSLENVRDLSHVYPSLLTIPDLALNVKLARVPPSPDLKFSDRAAKRLLELAPKSVSLLMRLVQENPPLVDLYKHVDNSGELVYINNILELDTTLYTPVKSPILENSIAVPSPITHLAVDLVASFPPKIRDMIPVIVSFVSGPNDFWLQPRESFNKLNLLMRELQLWYKAESSPQTRIPGNRVEINGFYAAYDIATRLWHRVQVLKRQGCSYTVLLIDYGNQIILVGDNLYELSPKFCKLPAQAIRAKLAGVKPMAGDWSPDAKDFFRGLELVECFAFVQDILQDNTLLVELIDTQSSTEDVFISKLLIEKNMAAPEE